MSRTTWTPADIPDQSGRRALVTGVTSGIGEHTVVELARKGAEVILAARNKKKLDETLHRLRKDVPGATLHPLVVDVSDQASIRRAAASVTDPLHLLVNNAGVMITPYQRTTDGFELQMATNYLGPFALTGLLWPRLVESGDGRVVALSSQGSRMALRAPLADPRATDRRYSRVQAYAESKLADLMFALELDERARAHGAPVRSVAAHPGYSATGLMGTGINTGNAEGQMRRLAAIMQAVFSAVGQPAELGAHPTLMAATADLPGGSYVGPDGWLQMRGHPKVVRGRRLAHDSDARQQLWHLSEQATGVRFLS